MRWGREEETEGRAGKVSAESLGSQDPQRNGFVQRDPEITQGCENGRGSEARGSAVGWWGFQSGIGIKEVPGAPRRGVGSPASPSWRRPGHGSRDSWH